MFSGYSRVKFYCIVLADDWEIPTSAVALPAFLIWVESSWWELMAENWCSANISHLLVHVYSKFETTKIKTLKNMALETARLRWLPNSNVWSIWDCVQIIWSPPLNLGPQHSCPHLATLSLAVLTHHAMSGHGTDCLLSTVLRVHHEYCNLNWFYSCSVEACTHLLT
jgi:hypothetical protein